MSSNPLTEYKVSPEIFEVTTEYCKTLSVDKTAKALNLSVMQITEILDQKEVKRYVDAIFLEQGFMQRNALNDVMTSIIELKLEEMKESGLGSNKDILEILKVAHTMQMDHRKINKEETPGMVTNVQQNFGGDNYSKLLDRIVTGGDPVNGSK